MHWLHLAPALFPRAQDLCWLLAYTQTYAKTIPACFHSRLCCNVSQNHASRVHLCQMHASNGSECDAHLVQGVNALHGCGRSHTDLKPGNIQVYNWDDPSSLQVTILDLGSSVVQGQCELMLLLWSQNHICKARSAQSSSGIAIAICRSSLYITCCAATMCRRTTRQQCPRVASHVLR